MSGELPAGEGAGAPDAAGVSSGVGCAEVLALEGDGRESVLRCSGHCAGDLVLVDWGRRDQTLAKVGEPAAGAVYRNGTSAARSAAPLVVESAARAGTCSTAGRGHAVISMFLLPQRDADWPESAQATCGARSTDERQPGRRVRPRCAADADRQRNVGGSIISSSRRALYARLSRAAARTRGWQQALLAATPAPRRHGRRPWRPSLRGRESSPPVCLDARLGARM